MKVILLVESPLSRRDYDRFGVEVVNEHGFDVECWDMTALFHQKLWKWSKAQTFRFPGYVQISSMAQIKSLCDDLGEAVVMDHTCQHSLAPWLIGNRVRNLIKKSSAKICDCYAQANNSVTLFRQRPFRSRVTTKRILEKIFNYGASSLLKAVLGYFQEKQRPMVDYRLVAGTASLFRQPPYLKNAKKIWVHSFDYDSFLKLRNKGSAKNMIVFLDCGLGGDLHDYVRFKVKRFVTPELFRSAMIRVFDNLERCFNAPVVIAGHPKVDYEKDRNFFGQREVYQERTGELVRDCRLVVTNGSTADNFAVLWKKPLLLVTTDELEQGLHKRYLESECAALKTQIVNADSPLDDIHWVSLSQKPIAQYADYQNQVIKKEGTQETNSWEIFLDFLKKEKNPQDTRI